MSAKQQLVRRSSSGRLRLDLSYSSYISQPIRISHWCAWVIIVMTVLVGSLTGVNAETDVVIDSGTEATSASNNPAASATTIEARALDSTAGSTPVSSTPDNFADYAAEQIDTLKQEGIDLPNSVTEWIEPSSQKAVQQTGRLQGDMALSGEFNEAYYILDELNSGLPTLDTPANLYTPLAMLEFFQTAVMKQQYDLAAHALNLNLLDAREQTSKSIELARRLDYLLNKNQLYVFQELPDRPDGLVEPPIGNSSSIYGVARRSIQLGYVDYRERHVPIFIQRVRVGDNAPIWVFSAQTVDNINDLYERYQPPEFVRYLPAPLKLKIFGIALWEYVALGLFLVLTMSIGWLLSKLAGMIIHRRVDDEETTLTHGKKSLEDMVGKLTVPITFTISFSLIFALVSGNFPYIKSIATATRPIVWVALMLSAVWLGTRVINFFANRYRDLQIEGLAKDEYTTYRVRLTYLSVFRRVFIFFMILTSIWIGLSEFTNIEGLGQTLLTSAGIAGVVIGVAAQPTLGNIIAGMQVAITQPVRIGDTVIMEGSWSTIEDLRYTYAVLKTWDERRLIVPMRHFVTEIIENWSHTEFHQTCVVYLYVDYGADIDAIRQRFIEMVKAHDSWDQETEPAMIVTSISEDTIKLRGTLAADSPLEAWMMECAIREQMLAYLHETHKSYLPAERVILKHGEDDV